MKSNRFLDNWNGLITEKSSEESWVGVDEVSADLIKHLTKCTFAQLVGQQCLPLIRKKFLKKKLLSNRVLSSHYAVSQASLDRSGIEREIPDEALHRRKVYPYDLMGSASYSEYQSLHHQSGTAFSGRHQPTLTGFVPLETVKHTDIQRIPPGSDPSYKGRKVLNFTLTSFLHLRLEHAEVSGRVYPGLSDSTGHPTVGTVPVGALLCPGR